jgi:hypothetical protein
MRTDRNADGDFAPAILHIPDHRRRQPEAGQHHRGRGENHD